MSKGWIKLHRDIENHWVFKDSRYFHIWSCLLIKASYKSRTVMTTKGLVKLEVGDLVTSLEEISQVTRNSIQVVRRCLELLAEDQMIIRNSNSKGTHITICNYTSYQETQQVDNTKSTDKQHTGQQVDNTKSTTNKKERLKEGEELKNLSKNEEGVSDDPPHPHSDDHIDTLSLEVKTEPQKKESLRAAAKDFIPPTVDEAYQHCISRGMPNEEARKMGERFVRDYTLSNWIKTSGAPIIIWRITLNKFIDGWEDRGRPTQTQTPNPQQPRQKTTQGDRYNGVSQAEYERMIDMATRPDYNPNQIENGNNGTDPNDIGNIES